MTSSLVQAALGALADRSTSEPLLEAAIAVLRIATDHAISGDERGATVLWARAIERPFNTWSDDAACLVGELADHRLADTVIAYLLAAADETSLKVGVAAAAGPAVAGRLAETDLLALATRHSGSARASRHVARLIREVGQRRALSPNVVEHVVALLCGHPCWRTRLAGVDVAEAAGWMDADIAELLLIHDPEPTVRQYVAMKLPDLLDASATASIAELALRTERHRRPRGELLALVAGLPDALSRPRHLA